MLKVFQIGAAGGVGIKLAASLVAAGDQVTGMHRKAEQGELIRAAGATAVTGDLISDSVDQLAAAFAGHDVVVFSAGAHGTGQEQTRLIDGEGLKKSVEAAKLAGISRFVLVSVFMDAARGVSGSEGFENYMRVKREADVYLVASGLDYFIVRPGTLTNEPGSGEVTAGLALTYGDVARENVATFIFHVLKTPALNNEIIELVDGTTPAVHAVKQLVRS